MPAKLLSPALDAWTANGNRSPAVVDLVGGDRVDVAAGEQVVGEDAIEREDVERRWRRTAVRVVVDEVEPDAGAELLPHDRHRRRPRRQGGDVLVERDVERRAVRRGRRLRLRALPLPCPHRVHGLPATIPRSGPDGQARLLDQRVSTAMRDACAVGSRPVRIVRVRDAAS
jgi:hypothetical protein